MADLDLLVDISATLGQISAGVSPSVLAHRSAFGARGSIVFSSVPSTKKVNARWMDEEEEFLRTYYGYLSEQEIADALGRTVNAVHIHVQREMKLSMPSKDPRIYTPITIAALMGVDPNTVHHLIDAGILEGRRLPMKRPIRVVNRMTFLCWVVNPAHWCYFDIRKIRDPYLRRLIKLQSKRWGDEWWTTGQVARYHGVESQRVEHQIILGKLPAVRWQNWRVRRSDATNPQLRFFKGAGRPGVSKNDWSPGADAFLVLARAVGLSWPDIERMMKRGRRQPENRFRSLHRSAQIPGIIRRQHLRVKYNARARRFQDVVRADLDAYRDRFRHLQRVRGEESA